jgi:shikimate kinase
MKLFLIGLPGSGKSTLAKELSKKLDYPLIDTDELICDQEASSIEKIFEENGENYFRELERDMLKDLMEDTSDCIISTGGGTPCFFDNMEVMNKHGITVFLNIPVKDIATRLVNSAEQSRPLLKGKDQIQIEKFLEEKLRERLPYYSKARIEIAGSYITADQVAEEILRQGLL